MAQTKDSTARKSRPWTSCGKARFPCLLPRRNLFPYSTRSLPRTFPIPLLCRNSVYPKPSLYPASTLEVRGTRFLFLHPQSLHFLDDGAHKTDLLHMDQMLDLTSTHK